MKSVFYTVGGLIILSLIYLYYSINLPLTFHNTYTKNNFESTTGTKHPNAGSGVDNFRILQNTNTFFGQAVGFAKNQDYTGALDLLEKAKNVAKASNERGIIDFNIASNRFELNRLDGARYYTDLAKNTDYTVDIRALSMQRIYLMYSKYGDVSILRAATDNMGIVWISEDQAKLDYMKQAYALYPLPGSSLFLMQKELDRVTNKSDAESIYQKYKVSIDTGIVMMQQSQGELTEATSAMLLRAIILGDLYKNYGIASRGEIEKLYKSLIQFDQEKGLSINKQYTLVYYANFLADNKDAVGAENTIKILLEDGLDPALNEGLPKTKKLSALRNMTPIADKSVQEFIAFLGPIPR